MISFKAIESENSHDKKCYSLKTTNSFFFFPSLFVKVFTRSCFGGRLICPSNNMLWIEWLIVGLWCVLYFTVHIHTDTDWASGSPQKNCSQWNCARFVFKWPFVRAHTLFFFHLLPIFILFASITAIFITCDDTAEIAQTHCTFGIDCAQMLITMIHQTIQQMIHLISLFNGHY